MLRIAICDDEESMRNRMEYLARTLADELNIPLSCQLFKSGTDLLASYPAHLDVLFLDVRLNATETGVTVAQRIRKTDPSVAIVFASSYPEYAVAGYRVQAYRFLVKPLEYAEFRHEITSLFKHAAQADRRTLSVRSDSRVYAIPFDHISYLETTTGKKVAIHCEEGTLTSTGGLSSWEAKLPTDEFYRVHASFIVALKAVLSCTQTEVQLIDGAVIPLSKHRRKEFLCAHARYIGRQL